jgi:hypothetical protein
MRRKRRARKAISNIKAKSILNRYESIPGMVNYQDHLLPCEVKTFNSDSIGCSEEKAPIH